MLSNFHKTTSEHWQRTPGAQKFSPFSFKGGRTKYKRQKRETKELGTETHPGEGAVKEFPNTRKISHLRVCGEFWNLRGQYNQEGKKKKPPRNKLLTATPSGEVAQMLTSTTSKWGLNREAWAACLG